MSRGEGHEVAPVRAQRRGMPIWWHLVVAVLVLALVQALVVKLYQVPSGSMEQTLAPGDRLLVNRLAYAASEPERGDVVVFEASGAWKNDTASADDSALVAAVKWLGDLVGVGPGTGRALVKRVIGLPGETVVCCDVEGRVTVDGEPLDEPWVFEDLPFVSGEMDCASEVRSPRCFEPVTVPAGEYLVLGDHRSASADSVVGCRGSPASDCARFVEREAIVGRAFVVVLPFAHWRGL